ncbi:energy transducer TonB [Nisaea acidiphila]|uniref:Energy transducer TonB n=1 Tax=Nisaea acidiphila TaxID=1862145 RepID=A0A9J7ARQ9_9PROT|nr:energy transducer TonB [Nisaea acidiphila]UUX49012.1 energy transducer TonB [Nisaea acidiphila]
MSAAIDIRGNVSSKVTGFTVAVALHGAVIWSMAVFEDPATGAFDTASGGLTIMIGEAGGAQELGEVATTLVEGVTEGQADEVSLEQAPPVAPVDVPETAEEIMEPVDTVPVTDLVETVEAAPAEPVEVAEAVEPDPVEVPVEPEAVSVEAVEVPEVETETVETVDVADAPPPVPQSRPKPAPKVETAAAPATVPPKPAEPVKPAEVPVAEPALERSLAQQKKGNSTFNALASAPTRSAVAGASQASSGGGGAAGAQKSYYASLQNWLERHKKYPRAARLRRYEGTVQFRFMIDRSGSVLEHAIVQSSGKRVLDDAVLDLLKRADPLPSMPPEIAGATLELTTSIDFRLR